MIRNAWIIRMHECCTREACNLTKVHWVYWVVALMQQETRQHGTLPTHCIAALVVSQPIRLTMNSRWFAIWPEAPVTATLTVFCHALVRFGSSCGHNTARQPARWHQRSNSSSKCKFESSPHILCVVGQLEDTILLQLLMFCCVAACCRGCHGNSWCLSTNQSGPTGADPLGPGSQARLPCIIEKTEFPSA